MIKESIQPKFKMVTTSTRVCYLYNLFEAHLNILNCYKWWLTNLHRISPWELAGRKKKCKFSKKNIQNKARNHSRYQTPITWSKIEQMNHSAPWLEGQQQHKNLQTASSTFELCQDQTKSNKTKGKTRKKEKP